MKQLWFSLSSILRSWNIYILKRDQSQCQECQLYKVSPLCSRTSVYYWLYVALHGFRINGAYEKWRKCKVYLSHVNNIHMCGDVLLRYLKLSVLRDDLWASKPVLSGTGAITFNYGTGTETPVLNNQPAGATCHTTSRSANFPSIILLPKVVHYTLEYK